MIVFVLIVLIMLLSVFGRAILYSPYGTYTIFKGSHKAIQDYVVAKPRIFSLKNKKNSRWFKCTATIFNSRYYLDKLEGKQINRLFGYSANLFGSHKKNSLSLGWRYLPVENTVELVLYWYDKDGRHLQSLVNKTPELFDQVSFQIELCTTSKQHVLIIDGEYFSIYHKNQVGRYGWILPPHFGGQKAAPHNIKVILEE